MICNLVSAYFDNLQLAYNKNNWSRGMLNFDFLEKVQIIVSPPHWANDFSRKMFLMFYSINWPNFIAIWYFEQ